MADVKACWRQRGNHVQGCRACADSAHMAMIAAFFASSFSAALP